MVLGLVELEHELAAHKKIVALTSLCTAKMVAAPLLRLYSAAKELPALELVGLGARLDFPRSQDIHR